MLYMNEVASGFPDYTKVLTGSLARWRLFERWLEETLARGDVWFAPLEEIAAYCQARNPRVEQLPYSQ